MLEPQVPDAIPDASKAILRSFLQDGTCFCFTFLADRRWAITRDGSLIAEGENSKPSIQFGVKTYVTLTEVTKNSSSIN